MSAWSAAKQAYSKMSSAAGAYVANDDPLAAAANAGAFLVWSSQPLYPLYVWLLVGSGAWPAFLSWLSTPFFFSVPLVARKSSIAGRAWFVVTGVFNTLVSLAAFGPNAAIGWFLVPCGIIAAGFFRPREWAIAATLCLLVLLGALTIGHLGPGPVPYDAAQNRSLTHLNLWSAVVLSAYLAYGAIRAHQTA